MHECTVCLDTIKGISTFIDDDALCENCIVSEIIPKFHLALKHEFQYPVAWAADTTLDPRDFTQYLDGGFLRQWYTKIVEYNTTVQNRLYCSDCSTFLSVRSTSREADIANCKKYSTNTCTLCAASISFKDGHDCADEEQLPAHGEAFKGLLKGKDYQICPAESCGAPYELRDGCNAVRCPNTSCGAQFRYLCGLEAHWTSAVGKCPRFGQRGAEGAIFDNVDLDLVQQMRALVVGGRHVLPEDLLHVEAARIFNQIFRVNEL